MEKALRRRWEREEGAGEEVVRARARRVGTVPSEKEVEERNMDHGVLRSWCPHCVKGRAEAFGRVRKVHGESGAPTVGVDYMHTHSEQEKEEEVGMPIVVVKDRETKMVLAKAVPSKRVKEALRRETDVEIALEVVPEGDHVENSVTNAQGQFRWHRRKN